MACDVVSGKPTKAVEDYLAANPLTSGAVYVSVRWRGVETATVSRGGRVVAVGSSAGRWRELRYHGTDAVGLLRVVEALPPGKWDLFDFPTTLTPRLAGLGEVSVDEPADLFGYLGGAPDAPGLPRGLRLAALRPRDAALVHKRWGLDESGRMLPFFRHRIRKGPTAAVFDGKKPVAWAGTYHETPWVVQLGYAFVEPEYRRRGLGRAVTSELLRKVLALGKTPLAHVWETNDASQAMVRGYGFRPLAKRFWGSLELH